ncbi:unnamed protein product [Cylicocyclus nassatus]|uniref:Uncharacterized protein n=1 Tax=Cylicocyclus nassatus TaxID=53992 RepID=A0AA36GXV4_CYLNA|nr:unnamed protein product [Cylicocyclus nassatus]
MHSAAIFLFALLVVDTSYCNAQQYSSLFGGEPILDGVRLMQYKPKRNYDFVRFGRSGSPSKKASYDYIRFGKRSGTQENFDTSRYASIDQL